MARMGLLVMLACAARAAAADPPPLPPDLRYHDGEAIPPTEFDVSLGDTPAVRGHGAALLFDGNNASAWCAGPARNGQGATLTIRFHTPQRLEGIDVLNVWARDFQHARDNGAVTSLLVITDARSFSLDLADRTTNAVGRDCNDGFRSFEPCEPFTVDELVRALRGVPFRLGRHMGDNPHDTFIPEAIETSKVTLVVRRVRPGRRSHLTCASSLTLYRPRPSR